MNLLLEILPVKIKGCHFFGTCHFVNTLQFCKIGQYLVWTGWEHFTWLGLLIDKFYDLFPLIENLNHTRAPSLELGALFKWATNHTMHIGPKGFIILFVQHGIMKSSSTQVGQKKYNNKHFVYIFTHTHTSWPQFFSWISSRALQKYCTEFF